MASYASDEPRGNTGWNGALLAVLAVVVVGAGAYFLSTYSSSPRSQGGPSVAAGATQTDRSGAAGSTLQSQHNGLPDSLSGTIDTELSANSAVPLAARPQDGSQGNSRPQLTEENRKRLIERGYMELSDGGWASYSSYDKATLRQMANGGDRAAQVAASQKTAFTIEERATYAEMAAARGYTAGLFKFGKAMELMPSNANARRLSYAYQLAAAELGDPAALAFPNLREDAARGLTPDEVAYGDEIAAAIVRRVTASK